MESANLDAIDTWHDAGLAGDTTYESCLTTEVTLCLHDAATGKVKWIGDADVEYYTHDGKVIDLCRATWGSLDNDEVPPAPRKAGSLWFEPVDVVVAEDYYLHVRCVTETWAKYTDVANAGEYATA